MKYVVAELDAEWSGYWTDPRPYLAVLPELSAALPAGARAFATDPGHYSFSGTTCTKDLELASVSVPVKEADDLDITFSPNRFKHDHPLRITYSGVTHFELLRDSANRLTGAEPERYRVLMDEILPEGDGGCLHEIALAGATLRVGAADLRAVWGP